MLTVTFGGNFCYFPLMRYDYVFVDDTSTTCPEKVVHPQVVHVSSGNTTSRRYRIAFLLREVFSRLNDDLLVVDSDVYLPPFHSEKPVTLCIPAKAKPYSHVILFCDSTNNYVTKDRVKQAYRVMDDYLSRELYKDFPVDVYLVHSLHLPTLSVPGTYHFIDGEKWYIRPDRRVEKSLKV